jgi:Rrf2 family protein
MRPKWSDIWIMLKLSKKVDYGLISLMHLARHGDQSSWSAREIAETYDLPVGLLAKVLQKLGRKGLVVSTQGTKGGYTLGRPAEQISAAAVVEAIDGPVSLAQCFSSEGSCVQFAKCNLKSPLQRLNDSVFQMLSQVNIAQMVELEEKDLKSQPAGQSSEALEKDSKGLTPLPVLR